MCVCVCVGGGGGIIALEFFVFQNILKCPYYQIVDIHFFTFSCKIWLSYISCQISIHYEHYKSFLLDFYFREFTAAINCPCSKAWLRIRENDVWCSKIPHKLKL